jgi:DNA/RNA endonuclease G (NUC1)
LVYLIYNHQIPLVKRILLVSILLYIYSSLQAQHTISIHHTYYTMQFDTIQSTELLGYYIQTTAHATAQPKIPRKGKFARFYTDSLLKGRVISYDKQYKSWNKQHPGQSRDRGHINPFTAFNFAEDAALESMYYSNTAPQASYFNEHQWQAVEQYVLKLSRGSKTQTPVDSIHVWTGVLIDTLHPKKMNDVFEPDSYWKVISYNRNGQPVTEAWLGINESSNRNTDPDAIKVDVFYLKDVIRKYYPRLQLNF